MPMSPVVQRNFDKWIKVSTWHTDHPLDEKRFFKFVWAVVQYSKRKPGESDLENLIIAPWRGKIAQDYLEAKARKYAGLYVTLCDFAKVRK